MQQNGKNIVLFLLIIISIAYMSAASSSDNSKNGLVILIGTDNGEHLAGKDINISITVKNQNMLPVEISTLQYQVIYASLNIPVVKGEMIWERKIQPGDTYYSSRSFSLPDYAPSGRYRIVAHLLSSDANELGSSGSEITVKASYQGIAGAAGIFLLYALAVIALFAIIFYYRCSESRKE